MQTESVRPPRVKIAHYFCYPKQGSNFNQIYSNFQANYDSKAWIITKDQIWLCINTYNFPLFLIGNPIPMSPLATVGAKVICICFVVLQTCPDSCHSDMLDFELDTGIGGNFGIGFLQEK